MEQNLGEWIRDNYDVVKKLSRAGFISSMIISRYHTYNYFLTTKNDSLMVRYDETAENMGVSYSTVVRSVKQMQTKI